MQSLTSARREAKPAGVIDTLTAGYGIINRQPWVLLLPILVDLFLWQGPRISISPLVDPVLAQASEIVRQADPALLAEGGSAVAEGSPAVQIEALRQGATAAAVDTNALALLARNPLGVPSIMTLLGGNGAFRFVGGWGEAFALGLSTLAAGMLAGATLRGTLAAQVRDGRVRPLSIVGYVPRGVTRAIGLSLLLLGTGVLLGLPVVLVLAVAALVAPAVATVAVLAVALGLALLEIYLFFTVEAIFVSRVGPVAALRSSVRVVRRFFWPTVALVGLTALILAGMDQVWQLVATRVNAPLGVVLSILGNAYIACGLIAARMIFYNDRAPLAAPTT